MSRQLLTCGTVVLAAVLTGAAGCRPQQPFYFFDDKDLSHYVGVATDIDYPDVDSPSLAEVEGAGPPLTLANPDPSSIEDLTLECAVRIALENSKVLRNLGGVAFGPQGAQGVPTLLTSNPEFAPTIYEPARSETDPRFGVEGALSAFDAQLTTSMFWEKNSTPQNVAGIVEQFRPRVFMQDLGTFQAQLSKTAATGGTWSLTHHVNYELNNQSPQVRASAAEYAIDFEAAVRQPILQGAGVQFNRIAGPGSIPGFYNGVMIARIRTDISLADFEAGVRNLVSDVERTYWNLYYAYRRLDAAVSGRDSALQTWQQVHAKFVAGAKGGSAQDEAQARQQYFLFRSTVEQSLANLYKTERILRYLMGLAATDGRLFRPSDNPTTAEVEFDWYETHGESLSRAVEIRQQKWRIKQRELELIAAKNYVLPRLDGVALYRWRGLGSELIAQERGVSPQGIYDNAWASMTSGEFQEWQLGFEFRMPLGFRRELAGVRNAELNLARERTVLQEQELELSHQLADAFNDLAENYRVSESNFNRRVAADKEVRAVRAAYEQGTITVDLLLDAQRRLAEAEAEYYRSLVDYNLAITQVHLRKGSLLEYNGVYLAEGPWPGKAYFDARRRARARDASLYLDYGFTMPKVISRGPYNQEAGTGAIFDSGSSLSDAPSPELVPTPAPQPSPQPAPLETEKGNVTTPISSSSSAPPVRGPSAQAGQVSRLSFAGPSDLAVRSVESTAASIPTSVAGREPVQPAGYLQAQRSASQPSEVAPVVWKGTGPAAGVLTSATATATGSAANLSSSGWRKAGASR